MSNRFTDDTEVIDDRQPAEEVVVTAADGHELIGYVIRTDAVLALEPDLELPLSVRIGGRTVRATAAYAPEAPGAAAARMTALQLPEGTVRVDGDRSVPGIEEEPGRGGRRSMWCWFFPRLSGC